MALIPALRLQTDVQQLHLQLAFLLDQCPCRCLDATCLQGSHHDQQSKQLVCIHSLNAALHGMCFPPRTRVRHPYATARQGA